MTSGKFIRTLILSAFALGTLASVCAQDAWPSRPIKIIVPFPAGGSSDPPMRVLALRLQEALGQSVIALVACLARAPLIMPGSRVRVPPLLLL